MASYDSDSSDGEFEETNVLLGYASKEADDDTISRIGGCPDWLDPENAPSAAYARCKVCKDLMVLLLQINGELPERFPEHDRRLYVFTCRRQTCRRREGSIRALRGVRVWKEEAPKQELKEEKEEEQQKPKNDGPGLGEALFGAKGLGGGANPFASNANPFSSSSSSSNPFSSGASSNPFSSQPAKPIPAAAPTAVDKVTAALPKTFAETLSINVSPAVPPPPAEPWPASQPDAYPMLYLADADFETLDSTPAKLPENARIEDADAPEPSILDREAFESTMDAAFQKFADRLAQNPDQVIRYEFAGMPLLYSKKDRVGEAVTKGALPRCAACGARRVFEVQLMPNAIAELEADDMSLDGMEWGTIIVGVCEKDCSPRGTELGKVGYLEEWAGVQWEELSKGK
ncbi:programmed cell death protein 2 [Dactylonectria estremocensis]|uniref:Programmed cell death protein 2 n=1 Tax=Dactylonectria estremocensis TaxID=1079267 RepID=A0A9P9F3K3_9HYPO|nr:programmed cell death protein 2 [Dactylonectria estremocensis]